MTFGLAKCAYIYIERGKRKSLGKKIDINGIEISELEEGDMYKYLGVDEDIGFDGPLNKEKIKSFYRERGRFGSESYIHEIKLQRITHSLCPYRQRQSVY